MSFTSALVTRTGRVSRVSGSTQVRHNGIKFHHHSTDHESREGVTKEVNKMMNMDEREAGSVTQVVMR